MYRLAKLVCCCILCKHSSNNAFLFGVVVIPIERLEEVVKSAEEIMAKELAMLEALQAGESILDVDRRFNYEHMLRQPTSEKK